MDASGTPRGPVADPESSPRRRLLPPWLLAAALGLLTGTGGYTFWYAEGTSYLSDDPRACVNCHIMREVYEGWSRSGHHAVATCNDCHVPHDLVGKYLSKASNGYHHSAAFTLGGFHEPIRITEHNRKLLARNCVRCHRALVSHLADHTRNRPEGEAGGGGCLHCHRDVGHGPTR